jgi:hypothetical protein
MTTIRSFSFPLSRHIKRTGQANRPPRLLPGGTFLEEADQSSKSVSIVCSARQHTASTQAQGMEEKDESTQPLLANKSSGRAEAERERQHLTLPVRSPESDDEGDESEDDDLEEEDEEGGGNSRLRRWLAGWCLPRLPTIHKHLRATQQVLAIPLVEAFGTGFLTLAVAMLSRPGAATPALTAGLAVAAVLAAMIYAGARISGSHYNPAVTVTLLLLRKVTPFQALVYVGSQIGGAVGGAHLGKALVSPELLADPSVATVRGVLVLHVAKLDGNREGLDSRDIHQTGNLPLGPRGDRLYLRALLRRPPHHPPARAAAQQVRTHPCVLVYTHSPSPSH